MKKVVFEVTVADRDVRELETMLYDLADNFESTIYDVSVHDADESVQEE